MNRDEAARQFLLKIRGLVADYHKAAQSTGTLSDAIRTILAEERKRASGDGAGFDRAAVRACADQECHEIERSWPVEKPPSIRMLYAALQEVVHLCQ
jgi:hypothetical protein